ncbi:hypothetical protein H5410_044310, partial [Solanum commersonii]
MPHPCWILQKYTIFGESDTHPLTFLKSLSNIDGNYLVVVLLLFQFTCLETVHKLLQKRFHLSKEAVMIFLIRAENWGMEKPRL